MKEVTQRFLYKCAFFEVFLGMFPLLKLEKFCSSALVDLITIASIFVIAKMHQERTSRNAKKNAASRFSFRSNLKKFIQNSIKFNNQGLYTLKI